MPASFYAHSPHWATRDKPVQIDASTEDWRRWHLLSEHLGGTADRAGAFAAKFGAEDFARVAGLLHDIGKYSQPFQDRLRGSGQRVNHSTAGAQIAVERWQRVGKLMAFAIAGHHAGLANGSSGGDGRGTFPLPLCERLADRSLPPLNSAWEQEITLPQQLSPPAMRRRDPNRSGFQFAFMTRMLFSCLVDADHLDTEYYAAQLKGQTPERGQHPTLADLQQRLTQHLRAKIETASDSAVNRQRRIILEHVRAKAKEAPGIFSLTVPTGGGKTLTSLAFALDHALAQDLERVIYVIPFTSIIEQTAQVFRAAIGEEAVLEHHSAFDESKNTKREGLEKCRLAIDNWDAPVVVTTAVQFFESLFANRPSQCRKLHNIARSVVILDEAQTLPQPLLRPCVAALDELALNYHASIVLCTATQPALAETDDPNRSFPGGLHNVRELAPDPKALAMQLRRVRVSYGGELSDEKLSAQLRAENQVLCIVNNRRHARALYDRIAPLGGAYHLTTWMCARHRSKVLEQVRDCLKTGHPCRLIATSLVEAGVDIDFPAVYRAEAGIDSIAQAAGRCNREGQRHRDDSRVVVFAAEECWKAPSELKQYADVGRSILQQYRKDPLSLEAIEAYFREVYWLKELGSQSELDKHDILRQFRERADNLDFPFATVSEQFKMIDNFMQPVIIPSQAIDKTDVTTDKWIKELEHVASPGKIARQLQPWVVNVSPRDRIGLIVAGSARAIREREFGDQFVVLTNGALYDPNCGLGCDDPTYKDPSDLIVDK